VDALVSAPLYPSAWKGLSQKSMCRTVHMAPILRQIRPLITLRAQNSNHYISRTGIKMRLGQYAVPRQGANAGGGVAGDSTPGLLFGDWSAWDR
jgi:hypothetical protein